MSTRLRACLVLGCLFLTAGLLVDRYASAEIVDTKLVYDGVRKGLGHQGVTKGPGTVWYVFHTRQVFRYETGDFTVPQVGLHRNERVFDHADFYRG